MGEYRVRGTQRTQDFEPSWESCHQLLANIEQEKRRGFPHVARLIDAASASLSKLAEGDLDKWLPLQLRFAGLLLELARYDAATEAYAGAELQIVSRTASQEYEKRLEPYAESLLGQAAALFEQKSLLAAQQKVEMYLGLSEFLSNAGRLTWARELQGQIQESLQHPTAHSPLERNLARVGVINQQIEKAMQQEATVGERVRALEDKRAALKSEVEQLETQLGESKKRLQQIVQATDGWQEKQAKIIAQISLPSIDAALAKGAFAVAEHPMFGMLKEYKPQIVQRVRKALEQGAPDEEVMQLTNPFAEAEALFYVSLAKGQIIEAREGSGPGLTHLLQSWRDYLGAHEERQRRLLAWEEEARRQQAKVENGRKEVEQMHQELARQVERMAQAEKELGQRQESLQSEREEISRCKAELAAQEEELQQRIVALKAQEEKGDARARELAIQEEQNKALEASLLAKLALAHQPPVAETSAAQANQPDADTFAISSDLSAVVGAQYEQPTNDGVPSTVKQNFFPWQV